MTGSLTVSVLATGDPTSAITLISPIAPGQIVSISFKVTVTAIPNPNPAPNTMTAAFTYTTDPNGMTGSIQSNTVTTAVFRNNYSQEISDLIGSIALEEAALAAITDSEGAKIQKVLSMPGVTTQQLLYLNKNIADMLDTLALLEGILKQKLEIVDCQINSSIC